MLLKNVPYLQEIGIGTKKYSEQGTALLGPEQQLDRVDLRTSEIYQVRRVRPNFDVNSPASQTSADKERRAYSIQLCLRAMTQNYYVTAL